MRVNLRTSALACQKWGISFLCGAPRRGREAGRIGVGRPGGTGEGELRRRRSGERADGIGRSAGSGASRRDRGPREVASPGSGADRQVRGRVAGIGAGAVVRREAGSTGGHRVSSFPFVSDPLPTRLRSPEDNGGMGTFISHTSALHVLRQGFGERASQSKAQPLPSVKPCLDAARTYVPEGEPVHVSIRDRASRGSHAFCYHIHRRSFPFGSFCALDESTYVASPELCFLQLAETLSLPSLAIVGMELCGTYRCTGSASVDEGSFAYEPSTFQTAPLTSAAKIRRFIDRCGGERGVKAARSAMPFVLDGSASPMESIVAALMALPARLGGWGMPVPKLNYEIAIAKDASHRPFGTRRRCDFFWPGCDVALEYDSRSFHAQQGAFVRDSVRRDELMHEGVRVLTMTPGQLFDFALFEGAMRSLGRALGVRVRTRVADAETRRRALHRLLLHGA